MTQNQKPLVRWSLGTGFDLFASLHVLHHPEIFGLRASWAAGVRSRLAPSQRSILEEAQHLIFSNPIAWVASLVEPRDATVVLAALLQMDPKKRLSNLASHADVSHHLLEMLKEVEASGKWDQANLEQLEKEYPIKVSPPSKDELVTALNWWVRPVEFGERYLDALQAYVTVFFAEEEVRIRPYLLQALDHAKQLASQLEFSQLMLELSQGVKMAAFEEADEVIFAPSYWTTPLVMYDTIIPKHWMVLYGARPAEVALVPGEQVPDAMLRALKALSDPTRLLILRYLSDQPLTPSQLARKLRLRAPTVTHHLSALRLAGLVYVTRDNAEENRYTIRDAVVDDTFEAIQKFLAIKKGQ